MDLIRRLLGRRDAPEPEDLPERVPFSYPTPWPNVTKLTKYPPVELTKIALDVAPEPGWDMYGVIVDDDGRSNYGWRVALTNWAKRAGVEVWPGSEIIKHRPDGKVRLACNAHVEG